MEAGEAVRSRRGSARSASRAPSVVRRAGLHSAPRDSLWLSHLRNCGRYSRHLSLDLVQCWEHRVYGPQLLENFLDELLTAGIKMLFEGFDVRRDDHMRYLAGRKALAIRLDIATLSFAPV
jgi:hypothetical protein